MISLRILSGVPYLSLDLCIRHQFADSQLQQDTLLAEGCVFFVFKEFFDLENIQKIRRTTSFSWQLRLRLSVNLAKQAVLWFGCFVSLVQLFLL